MERKVNLHTAPQSNAATHSSYPRHAQVPERLRPWSMEYPSYRPIEFVAQVVLDNYPNGWADDSDPKNTAMRRGFTSYTGELSISEDGRPLNPLGRTGISNRGLLGKWGANYAADPLITRVNPKTGELEMLAIRRKDNGKWAMPGGMCDKGEVIADTIRRELEEETGLKLDWSGAREVYRGPVDDERNTDNAWMETVVMHLHLTEDMAAKLNPRAGDDAADVTWLPVNEMNLSDLSANHGKFVRLALGEIALKSPLDGSFFENP